MVTMPNRRAWATVRVLSYCPILSALSVLSAIAGSLSYVL